MMLEPIKNLLEQSVLKNVDTVRLWEQIQTSHISFVESLSDLLEYRPLVCDTGLKIPHAIAINTPQGLSVSVMLDVVASGLTSLLESQLGYIPRYAVCEWILNPPQIAMQNLVVCIGHHTHSESLSNAVQALAVFSGQLPTVDVVQAIAENPLLNKAWCYSVLPALRSRGMLHEANIGTHQHPIWTATLNATRSSQVH